jgi:hypothetical protein
MTNALAALGAFYAVKLLIRIGRAMFVNGNCGRGKHHWSVER